MTDGELCRRVSICRQLSDAWKSKRKSYSDSHSSNSKFVWNCALTEEDSPVHQQIDKQYFVKQKSISYHDMTYLSSEHESIENGHLSSFSVQEKKISD